MERSCEQACVGSVCPAISAGALEAKNPDQARRHEHCQTVPRDGAIPALASSQATKSVRFPGGPIRCIQQTLVSGSCHRRACNVLRSAIAAVVGPAVLAAACTSGDGGRSTTPDAAPIADAGEGGASTDLDGGVGDAPLGSDADACAVDLLDGNVVAYPFPAFDAGGPCPEGEFRASDYGGPPSDAGFPYLGPPQYDGLCHVLCRCDSDCDGAGEHCADRPLFRGDDVQREDRKVRICR